MLLTSAGRKGGSRRGSGPVVVDVPRPPGIPESDSRWPLVLRVAAGVPFRKSVRLRDFLLYVCERSLQGDLDAIREQQIGCAVFSRSRDYSPADDNIVRVEARQLRKRLEDYFAGEGAGEPIVITIPRGSYVPVFQPREPDTPQGPVSDPPAAFFGHRNHVTHWILSIAALVLATAACVWLIWQGGPAAGSLPFPWSAVLDRGYRTTIVLPDSSLKLVHDLTGRHVPLGDYASQGFVPKLKEHAADPQIRALLDLVNGRRSTSAGAASLVQKIVQMSTGSQDRIVVTHARDLEARDFKTDHIVLLGGPYSNPWLELVQPGMNFRFEMDTAARTASVRNVSPRPGEQPAYAAEAGTAYAVIAVLPNADRTRNVLVVAGTGTDASEAAGDLLTNPDLMARALSRLGIKPGDRAPYFEMLLRCRSVGGASDDTQPVAFRLLDR